MGKRLTLTCALALACTVQFSAVANAGDEAPPYAQASEKDKIHWQHFSELAVLETPYMSSKPVDLADGIKVGSLQEQQNSKMLVESFANELAMSKHGNYDSLLIAKNNELLFESYFLRGRVDLSHPQSSATKTYTSLALGRAMQLGYLSMADLDRPLTYFLRDLDPSKFAEGAKDITLRQSLTMTTGIRISEEGWDALQADPAKIKGQNEVQAIFERTAPITEASRTFKYGTGPQFVMQVIEAVVPGTAKAFIKAELLDKLGIQNYGWKTAASGLPESGWRVSLTSRDMAKVGLLAINNGKWHGEQLIPKAYIKEATTRHLFNGDDDIFGGGKDVKNQGYGFFWWGTDLQSAGKTYEAVSAQGGGGMFIFLIRDLDLVIVATAHHREHDTQQLVAERIIPAFIQ